MTSHYQKALSLLDDEDPDTIVFLLRRVLTVDPNGLNASLLAPLLSNLFRMAALARCERNGSPTNRAASDSEEEEHDDDDDDGHDEDDNERELSELGSQVSDLFGSELSDLESETFYFGAGHDPDFTDDDDVGGEGVFETGDEEEDEARDEVEDEREDEEDEDEDGEESPLNLPVYSRAPSEGDIALPPPYSINPNVSDSEDEGYELSRGIPNVSDCEEEGFEYSPGEPSPAATPATPASTGVGMSMGWVDEVERDETDRRVWDWMGGMSGEGRKRGRDDDDEESDGRSSGVGGGSAFGISPDSSPTFSSPASDPRKRRRF
ncbi:hypothetical protein HK104_008856 [Borealophlyctis nickersoniae]|nr:hypothetical protein HK104_008856 [Borealophlyctis nickersoniae]